MAEPEEIVIEPTRKFQGKFSSSLAARAELFYALRKMSDEDYHAGRRVTRSANPHVADTDVHVKGNVNREEKERIARKAVELLNDNDSIIMASGSTIYAFAEAIKRA